MVFTLIRRSCAFVVVVSVAAPPTALSAPREPVGAAPGDELQIVDVATPTILQTPTGEPSIVAPEEVATLRAKVGRASDEVRIRWRVEPVPSPRVRGLPDALPARPLSGRTRG